VEGAKSKKFPRFFLKKWCGLERAKKDDENEYNSSLGGRSKKPIGAMNSKIGEV
jgi:hypothetical protein